MVTSELLSVVTCSDFGVVVGGDLFELRSCGRSQRQRMNETAGRWPAAGAGFEKKGNAKLWMGVGGPTRIKSF